MPDSPLPLRRRVLTLQLLGGFHVWLGEQKLAEPFPRRKAASLIKLLGLQPTFMLNREVVLSTLWPELAEKQATAQLYKTVSQARKILKDHANIEHERSRLRLIAPKGVQSDVVHFLDKAREALEQRSLTALRESKDALTGDLLPDDIQEGWTESYRSHIAETYNEVLLALGNEYLAAWDVGEATRLFELALTRDYCLEEAHRGLMHVFALRKEPEQLEDQYQACKRALMAELGEEPSRETEALLLELRQLSKEASKDKNNLPADLTTFVGRKVELERLSKHLTVHAARLITLHGLGGIGKTRLALELARNHTRMFDEVWFVSLEGISSNRGFATAIANSLRFQLSGKDILDDFISAVGKRNVLLILDSVEPNSEIKRFVHRLLMSAPGITMLVTAREPLNLYGEWLVKVEGLKVGTATEPLGEAEQLFLENLKRIGESRVDKERLLAIRDLCQWFGGMPLAIELTAAQATAIGLDELLQSHNLGSAMWSYANQSQRLQSVRFAFETTWQRLSEKEQRETSALSVFRGGFEYESALEVASAFYHSLQVFVSKSVLQITDGRFFQHPLLQEFLKEKLTLDRERLHLVQKTHANYYLKLAQEAEPKLKGEEQEVWLERLQLEYANLTVALEWSYNQSDISLLSDLCMALFNFWWTRGYFAEGLSYFDKLFMHLDQQTELRKAEIYEKAASFNLRMGNYEVSSSHFTECYHRYEVLGNVRGSANALGCLGSIAMSQGEYAQARSCFEDSHDQFKAVSDEFGIADSANSLGNIAFYQSNFKTAEKYYMLSLESYRELKNSQKVGLILTNLGIIYTMQGQRDEANKLFHESLDLLEAVGDMRGRANALNGLAAVARHRKDFRLAKTYFKRALSLFKEVGDKQAVAHLLQNIAGVAVDLNDDAEARRHYLESLPIYHELGDKRGRIFADMNLASLDFRAKRYAVAKDQYLQCLLDSIDLKSDELIAKLCFRLAHSLVCWNAKRCEFAAKLLCVSENLANRINLTFEPMESKEFQTAKNRIAELLGEQRFSELKQKVQDISFEEIEADLHRI